MIRVAILDYSRNYTFPQNSSDLLFSIPFSVLFGVLALDFLFAVTVKTHFSLHAFASFITALSNLERRTVFCHDTQRLNFILVIRLVELDFILNYDDSAQTSKLQFQIEAGYENICNKLQKMLEFKE